MPGTDGARDDVERVTIGDEKTNLQKAIAEAVEEVSRAV